MVPFEYIPDEIKPTKDKHIEYSTVYRALRESNVNKEDFYPSIVERNFVKKCKLFGGSGKTKQEDYSVSFL